MTKNAFCNLWESIRGNGYGHTLKWFPEHSGIIRSMMHISKSCDHLEMRANWNRKISEQSERNINIRLTSPILDPKGE